MQNPIENLSLEELYELQNNKQSNFLLAAKNVNGELITTYDGTKHFDLYKSILQYIVNEKITIKKGSKLLNFNYGEIADLLIKHEILKRKTKNNNENFLFEYSIEPIQVREEMLVDFLVGHIWTTDWVNYTLDEKLEVIEKARQMEKERIVKAYSKGYNDKDFSYFDPETYFNETYEIPKKND